MPLDHRSRLLRRMVLVLVRVLFGAQPKGDQMSADDQVDLSDEEPSRFAEARLDALLLDHLLLSPWPWTIEELAREVQEKGLDTADAIARLTETGLVHRLDRFVFPTRTARRAEELRVGTL